MIKKIWHILRVYFTCQRFAARHLQGTAWEEENSFMNELTDLFHPRKK